MNKKTENLCSVTMLSQTCISCSVSCVRYCVTILFQTKRTSNLLCFVLFLEHMNKILYLEQMTKIFASKCVSFIASFGVGIFSKLGHCVVFSDGQKLVYKGC